MKNLKNVVAGVVAATIVTGVLSPVNAHAQSSFGGSSFGGFSIPAPQLPPLPEFPKLPEIQLPPASSIPELPIPTPPPASSIPDFPAPTPPAPPANPGGNVIVDGVPLTADEARFVRDLNSYRASHGLAPLAVDANLMNQSKNWSRTMADRDIFEHSRDNVYENIAYNYDGSPGSFLKQWRESPGHNRNLLQPMVKKVGFAIVKDSRGRFYATNQLL